MFYYSMALQGAVFYMNGDESNSGGVNEATVTIDGAGFNSINSEYGGLLYISSYITKVDLTISNESKFEIIGATWGGSLIYSAAEVLDLNLTMSDSTI